MRYKDSLWEYCLHLLYFFPIIAVHTYTHRHTHTELIEVESFIYIMVFGTMVHAIFRDAKEKGYAGPVRF